MNYILVCPESHKHLGLFSDLEGLENVQVIVAEQKQPKSRFIRVLKKIHTSTSISKHLNLPLKNIWYKKICFDIEDNVNYCVIIVDAALKVLNVSYLNALFTKSNVRGVLCLINSIKAHSLSMIEVRPLIQKVHWDDIYSFDPQDIADYGFKSIDGAYYSRKTPEAILNSRNFYKKSTDVYFIGGLKGNREGPVVRVFSYLRDNGLDCDFNILLQGKDRLKKHAYPDEIYYYSGKWIPYEEVLSGVLNSNVIIEVLQDGQTGPSLRYYEAVCYNKKLLTTNEYVKRLPYYDPNLIKVFHKVEEIDIDWIKDKKSVDYHYAGDFSPIRLLEIVIK